MVKRSAAARGKIRAGGQVAAPGAQVVAMPRAHKVEPLVVSVGSGKGGVGKTLTAIHFALAARALGFRVLVLDADFGMANVDVLLGVESRHDIRDVIDGYVEFEALMVESPQGIWVVPSGSGLTQLSEMSAVVRQAIMDQVRRVETSFDVVVMDTAAGIGSNVLHLHGVAQRRVMVCTPDPHAITDVYALIKVLVEERGVRDFELLINMAHSEREARDVAFRVIETCVRFLEVRPNYLGWVPHDAVLGQWVKTRNLGEAALGSSVAARAWFELAQSSLGLDGFRPTPGSPRRFWSKMLTTAG